MVTLSIASTQRGLFSDMRFLFFVERLKYARVTCRMLFLHTNFHRAKHLMCKACTQLIRLFQGLVQENYLVIFVFCHQSLPLLSYNCFCVDLPELLTMTLCQSVVIIILLLSAFIEVGQIPTPQLPSSLMQLRWGLNSAINDHYNFIAATPAGHSDCECNYVFHVLGVRVYGGVLNLLVGMAWGGELYIDLVLVADCLPINFYPLSISAVSS